MKTWLIYAVGMFLLFSEIIHSQNWTTWKTDSTKIQIVKTKDGSKIRARVLDINPDRVTVKIYSETIDLPTDSIQSIKIEDRVVLDQEGRTKLLLTSTGLSLGFYAWGIPVALDIKNQQALAAGYLFLSAGGFFLPYYLTKNTEVSDAGATAYYYGSTRGIVHGTGLYVIAAGEEHWDHRAAIGAMITTSIAEGVGFYYLSEKLNYTGGRAEAVTTYADFGLINVGFYLPYILDIHDNRAQGAAIITGSTAGLVAGHYLTANEDYTRGDAYALYVSGYLGSYSGMTLSLIAGLDKDKPMMTSSMIGSLIGLGVGQKILKNKNFTTGQGFMIGLSSLAGALTGGGIAYLISKEPDEKLYSGLSCIGALGGYMVMFNSYTSSSENDISCANPVHFYINPLSLLMKDSGKKSSVAPIAGVNVMF